MPEPLKSKDANGLPFFRPPEIEACVAHLESVDAATRLQRFHVVSRRNRSYVPSEVLTYFLRRAWACGAQAEFREVFELLMRRVARSLASAITDSRMAGAEGIREEILGRFSERVAKDCNGRFAMLDFFEVRFDLALARFRKTVLRQIGPTSALTVSLYEDGDEALDLSPEVEAAAAEFLGGDPQKIDNEAFRLELEAAIDALPDDQRRVVGLLRQGFQIDSKDPNVVTIAKLLKCDERTVRNRRDRAVKSLRIALREDA